MMEPNAAMRRVFPVDKDNATASDESDNDDQTVVTCEVMDCEEQRTRSPSDDPARDGADAMWLARLTPWLPVLQSRLHLDGILQGLDRQRHGDSHDHVLWFKYIAPPQSDESRWLHQLEAMQLLVLLSHARPLVALQVLERICGSKFQATATELCAVAPTGDHLTLRLGFDLIFEFLEDITSGWAMGIFRRLIDRPFSAEMHSAAYREIIATFQHETTCIMSVGTVPLRLTVSPIEGRLSWMTSDQSTRIVSVCRDLAVLQHHHHRRRRQLGGANAAFYLQSVRFPTLVDPDYSQVLSLATQIAEAKVNIADFEFAFSKSPVPSGHLTYDTFRSLLGSHAPSAGLSMDSGPTCGITSLKLVEAHDVEQLALICSAIACSRTLKSIEVLDTAMWFNNPQDRELAWRWLAYALFSAEATHNIEALHFDGVDCFHTKNVATMAETLLAPNIYAKLSSQYRVVTVKPQAVVRFLSTSASFIDPSAFLHVIKDDSSCDDITAILPGSGLCFVNRADVVEMPSYFTPPQTRQYNGRHRIRRLKLLNSAAAEEALTSFTGLIGHGIQELELEYFAREHITRESFRNILRRCPSVELLRVNGTSRFASTWIQEAYGDGLLRASRLDLEFISSGEDLADLFTSLADKGHAMTQHLETLAIQLYDDDRGLLFDPVFEALVEMLRLNTSLCQVFLWTDLDDLVMRFRPLVNSHTKSFSPKMGLHGMPSDVRRADGFDSPAVNSKKWPKSWHRRALVMTA